MSRRCTSSLRDLFLLVVGFTLLTSYVSFQLGGSWRDLGSGHDADNSLRRTCYLPENSSLLAFLEKAEASLSRPTGGVPVAIVAGQRAVVARDLPLYRAELRDFQVWYRDHRIAEVNGSLFYVAKSPPDSPPPAWDLYLCMAFQQSERQCLAYEDFADLKPYQKVDKIPPLAGILWKKDALCRTLMKTEELSGWMRTLRQPPCLVVPPDPPPTGESRKWILKPLKNPGARDLYPKVLTMNDVFPADWKSGILQGYVEDALEVFGQPISARFYVLVTTAGPALRAYVHREGLVHHRHPEKKGFKKMAGRTWPLSELWVYLAANLGLTAVEAAARNVDVLLTSTLLAANFLLPSAWRCRQCYQLLGMDVMFSRADLRPVLLEVTGQPSLMRQGDRVAPVKRAVVADALRLLGTCAGPVADAPVSPALYRELLAADLPGKSLGLSPEEATLLLEGRRESINLTGYIQLYPSPTMDTYTDLVRELSNQLVSQEEARRILFMHHLQHRLEKMFSARNNRTEARFPIPLEEGGGGNSLMSLIQDGGCSEEPSALPYLAALTTDPPLQLSPTFSPHVTTYRATVDYDQLSLAVGGRARHCQVEVRLDDRFGPSRVTKYTLGVGENRLTLLLVDVRHTEPWVVNSYSLEVYRQPLGSPGPFTPGDPHQMCALTQECDMQVSPSETCSLYRDKSAANWTDFQTKVRDLPVCLTGDAPGRWVVPCGRCDNRHSCHWGNGTWQPYSCRHRTLDRASLEQCLAGKKLLFVGDSTNRGMMHYLMERLNGSLTRWDKTHHIRLYPEINRGRTFIGFSYYPQFWLPTSQRPVFDKALYQLIQRSRPLTNDSSTVLVVGGVHWLATQHLHMLLRALRVEKLQAIRLFMKTLGSGFHQPVEGVHTLTMEDQRKLLLHSAGLAEFARHYDIEVIETFNMTVARYKDFLQGKCACHFHRVVPVTGPQGTTFHVEGDINAIYSEILLSRLCSDR